MLSAIIHIGKLLSGSIRLYDTNGSIMSTIHSFIISSVFLSFTSDAARILAILPYPLHSHQIHNHALTIALAERGHQMTVFTAHPMKKDITNYTEYALHFDTSSIGKGSQSSGSPSRDLFPLLDNVYKLAVLVTDGVLSHPKIKEYLLPNATEIFDLMIISLGYHDGLFAIAEKLNIPMIVSSSISGMAIQHFQMGNPHLPGVFPDIFSQYSDQMNFWDRIGNFFCVMRQIYEFNYVSYPQQHAVLKKHFGDDAPAMDDLKYRISMMFLNTHPVLHDTRPMVPQILRIFGLRQHTMNKTLPADLKQLLDNAKQGFIYFSLGLNIKSVQLQGEVIKILMAAFSELPYLILWKYEGDTLPGKPDNVFISKWIPQYGVLAHPNIKLYIYQGGLQSTEEAVDAGVPLLGMPFFFDQKYILHCLTKKRVAVSLDLQSITKEGFKDAIREVVEKPEYKRNMLKIQALLRDRPHRPIDEAVWWTEYVIRHKGAPHMQRHKLPLYKAEMWDIYAFLAVLLIVCFYFLWKIFQLAIYVVQLRTRTHAVKIKEICVNSKKVKKS